MLCVCFCVPREFHIRFYDKNTQGRPPAARSPSTVRRFPRWRGHRRDSRPAASAARGAAAAARALYERCRRRSRAAAPRCRSSSTRTCPSTWTTSERSAWRTRSPTRARPSWWRSCTTRACRRASAASRFSTTTMGATTSRGAEATSRKRDVDRISKISDEFSTLIRRSPFYNAHEMPIVALDATPPARTRSSRPYVCAHGVRALARRGVSVAV